MTQTTVSTTLDTETLDEIERSLAEALSDAGVDPEQVQLSEIEAKRRDSLSNRATIEVEPR